MQWGVVRYAPGSRPLLPQSLRGAGIALLAACVVAVAVIAALLVGGGAGRHLDAALDPRIQTALGRFPSLLNQLPRLGGLPEVTLMTLALVLAFAVVRSRRGAVLTLVAVPGAVALTEYVLKPYVGGPLAQAFPSGHATSSFALAAVWAVLLVTPPFRSLPRPLRLVLALLALLMAAAVGAAMVAIGAHTFTDVVAGAAVGTGVVLACALALDLAGRRARR